LFTLCSAATALNSLKEGPHAAAAREHAPCNTWGGATTCIAPDGTQREVPPEPA
jgi:hypothetical protein